LVRSLFFQRFKPTCEHWHAGHSAFVDAWLTTELHQRRAEDTERKLGKVLERMEQEHGGPQDFPAEAAFVTFNRGMELQACLASCPHGKLSYAECDNQH
jgi:hypothetical protein